MNDEAKNILLYGDSFFWGVDSSNGGQRFKYSERIGTQLQYMLGDSFNVIEEGLRGRTMFGENGWFPERDGLAQFGPIFASHLPLDVVVIMLGTNDLNTKTNHAPADVALALEQYRDKIEYWCEFMNYTSPQIVVIAPPNIDDASLTAFKDIFSGSSSKIAPLADELAAMSKKLGLQFLDSRQIVESKDADGVHLNAGQNKKLAEAVKDAVIAIC